MITSAVVPEKCSSCGGLFSPEDLARFEEFSVCALCQPTGQSIGRYFGYFLDTLTLFIGYMMAGWDPEKRALHDRLCETRVIRTR